MNDWEKEMNELLTKSLPVFLRRCLTKDWVALLCVSKKHVVTMYISNSLFLLFVTNPFIIIHIRKLEYMF